MSTELVYVDVKSNNNNVWYYFLQFSNKLNQFRLISYIQTTTTNLNNLNNLSGIYVNNSIWMDFANQINKKHELNKIFVNAIKRINNNINTDDIKNDNNIIINNNQTKISIILPNKKLFQFISIPISIPISTKIMYANGDLYKLINIDTQSKWENFMMPSATANLPILSTYNFLNNNNTRQYEKYLTGNHLPKIVNDYSNVWIEQLVYVKAFSNQIHQNVLYIFLRLYFISNIRQQFKLVCYIRTPTNLDGSKVNKKIWSHYIDEIKIKTSIWNQILSSAMLKMITYLKGTIKQSLILPNRESIQISELTSIQLNNDTLYDLVFNGKSIPKWKQFNSGFHPTDVILNYVLHDIGNFFKQ